MIRTFLAAGAAVFTLAAAAAADIPPFNPPPEPIAPAGTTIGPDEVRFTPPGGPEIDSGRFAAVRSLNGEWLREARFRRFEVGQNRRSAQLVPEIPEDL